MLFSAHPNIHYRTINYVNMGGVLFGERRIFDTNLAIFA